MASSLPPLGVIVAKACGLLRLSMPTSLGVIFALLIVATDPCGHLDRRLNDVLFATMSTPPSGEIVIVDISRAALEQGDALRLPRRLIAKLLATTRDAGAKKVLLDMTLAGPTTPTDDDALAAELERISQTSAALTASALVTTGADGKSRWSRSTIYPAFAKMAAQVSSDLAFDTDGSLRRFGLSDRSLPDLQTSAGWLARRPLDSGTVQPIDFAIDARAFPVVDAARLLGGDANAIRQTAGALTGRTVVIASFSSALGGDIPVPRFGTLKRPVITALSAETLLRPHPLRVTGKLATALVVVLVAIVFVSWSSRMHIQLLIAVIGGIVLCDLGLAIQAQAHFGLLVPIATPVVAIAAGCLASQTYRAYTSRRAARAEEGAMVTFAKDGTVLSMNEAARKLLGLLQVSATTSIVDLFGARADELLAATDRSCPGRLIAVIDDRQIRRHLDLTVSTIRADGDGWVGMASIRDVTDQQAQIEELRRMVLVDPLTGAASRLSFERALAEACSSASAGGKGRAGFSVLLCDLDGFKAINDTHGHQAGDTLLRVVAERLGVAVPEGALVARLGGDEFAMLVYGRTSASAIDYLVEGLTAMVSAPVLLNTCEVAVGISIGVACFCDDHNTPPALMHAADTAMYANKRTRIQASRLQAA